MTPLLLGALASLAEVHPHFAPRAQLHPADVAQVAAAHPLDLGPLHAMRGGLTGLRNKLATQLADLHKLNLSEPGERGSGPLHPQEGRALDAHFDRLTHRLLGMEHSLAASHLQDPAHRATAAALDRIVEQTRGVLASVNAQTPAAALTKAKATLERLKRTLDGLPGARGRPRPHSLVEQTAASVQAQVAQVQAQQAKYDAADATVDELGSAMQRQVQGLQESQREETRAMADGLQHVLLQAGLVAPPPEPRRAKAPNLEVLAAPEAADLGALPDEAQLRGAA